MDVSKEMYYRNKKGEVGREVGDKFWVIEFRFTGLLGRFVDKEEFCPTEFLDREETCKYLDNISKASGLPYDVASVNFPRLTEDNRKAIVGAMYLWGAIPKENLEVNKIYFGGFRRCSLARWNGKVFEYPHFKFGGWREEQCLHFEDDLGFAVFVPFYEANEEQIKEFYSNWSNAV